jgi:hypothetical protein
VGALGLFHGLSFAAFPPAYLGGASVVQAALLAPLALVSVKMPRSWLRPLAGAVLAAGLAMFGFHLWRR